MSQLTKSEVVNLVTAVLNASPGVYGTSTVPLFTTGEIDDAVDAADQTVIGVIIDTIGHRARSQYVELVSISDGGQITGNFNGGVLVDGREGVHTTPGNLSTKKRNPNTISNDTKNGYYCIQGNTFNFIGSTAQVEVVTYEVGGGTLASPPEYVHAVIAGALAILFPKEGSNVEAASHFFNQQVAILDMIRKGATYLPAVTPFKGNP